MTKVGKVQIVKVPAIHVKFAIIVSIKKTEQAV